MKIKSLALILFFIPFFSMAKIPDCHSWPMNMAEVWLKNTGVVGIIRLDESKTSGI
ncbi:hypothetical protein [Erwinia mallotivora]|uniref:hypothetical protein n=1 Tax=Erwinia mallotivora TaxID=69222 RepID=UPI0004B02A8D|nr:hypothetical protein [Erwinia mallotivora]